MKRFLPPDIHIEIVSPGPADQEEPGEARLSTANGCPLGWLIDPERKTVEVYRPGRLPRTATR